MAKTLSTPPCTLKLSQGGFPRDNEMESSRGLSGNEGRTCNVTASKKSVPWGSLDLGGPFGVVPAELSIEVVFLPRSIGHWPGATSWEGAVACGYDTS